MDTKALQRKNDALKEAQQKLLAAVSGRRVAIDKILPAHLRGQRFLWLISEQIRMNPALANVSPASFLRCVLTSAMMGLEIMSKQAYLVPFGEECQLLIAYQGKMDLARRSGKVGSLGAYLVHEGDQFDWWIDETGPHVIHRHGRQRGEVTAGFAMAEIIGASRPQLLEPMSIDELDAIRRRSKKGVPNLSIAEIRGLDAVNLDFRDKRRTPWTTDLDAMLRKSLLHRLCNLLPQTPEMILAERVDAAFDLGQSTPVAGEALEIEFTAEEEQPMIPAGSAAAAADVAARRLADLGVAPAPAEKRDEGPCIDPEEAVRLADAYKNAGWSEDAFAAALRRRGWNSPLEVPASRLNEVLAAAVPAEPKRGIKL